MNNSTLDVPAPGNYEINSRAIEGPKYCLGMKTLNSLEMQDKVNKHRPGPGAYESVDVTKAKKAEPHFSFGTEKRPALGRNKD